MIIANTFERATIPLANFAADGPIGTAANTVDICSSFKITQTTLGRSLTIPAPTATIPNVIREIQVASDSTSTEMFTLAGQRIYPGETRIFYYLNSTWVTAESIFLSAVDQGASPNYRSFPNITSFTSMSTTVGAIIIHTPIVRTSDTMFRIRVHGYDYYRQKVVDFTVVGYAYPGSNGNVDGQPGRVIATSIVDNGDDYYQKTVGVNAAGNVAISIGDTTTTFYFMRFSVDLEIGMVGNAAILRKNYLSGWSVDQTTTAGFGWLDQTELYPTTVFERAQNSLVGGGTIRAFTVATNVWLSWSSAFLTMPIGYVSNVDTSGYYSITMPAVGTTITGLNGASSVTTTADGIPLQNNQSLVYILNPGSNSTSINANFRIVGIGNGQALPENWIVLATVRSTSGATGYAVKLGIGKTILSTVPGTTTLPTTYWGNITSSSYDQTEIQFLRAHDAPVTAVQLPESDNNNVYLNRARPVRIYVGMGSGASVFGLGNGYLNFQWGQGPLVAGGIVYGLGGLADVTLDAIGTIPLPTSAYDSLYAVPLNPGFVSTVYQLARVPYTYDGHIPNHWIRIATRGNGSDFDVNWIGGLKTCTYGEWQTITPAVGWQAYSAAEAPSYRIIPSASEPHHYVEFRGLMNRTVLGTTNNVNLWAALPGVTMSKASRLVAFSYGNTSSPTTLHSSFLNIATNGVATSWQFNAANIAAATSNYISLDGIKEACA